MIKWSCTALIVAVGTLSGCQTPSKPVPPPTPAASDIAAPGERELR